LLRTTRLQLVAGRLGFAKLEAGPKALAMTTTAKTPAKVVAALTKKAGAVRREDRLIFETSAPTGEEQIHFFERIILAARRP
jgi:transcription-repair coupling factor (superfamily II helicase)